LGASDIDAARMSDHNNGPFALGLTACAADRTLESHDPCWFIRHLLYI